ncbi:thermonuclease family protein [Bacillus sp. FJAT-27445]|uniref:thermonuclease family protein n=1 Tax=Bacillus sp. FJAT-27445 TaxID=1679166 RepID=UPI00074425AE|nr:thermonuclease family protein [Bacillus sp. FJAT-27445]
MVSKGYKIILVFLLSLFLAAGCSLPLKIGGTETGNVPAEVKSVNELFKAKVIKNIDGDTVVISLKGKEETVRLLCVDTPETQHPRLGVQPFGPEASDFAKTVLHKGKEIEVEPGINWGRDKYGRLLAYLYVDGKMFNELLLEKGLARVAYVYPPNTKYVDRFYKIQDKAKKKGVGIWSIENYATEEGYQTGIPGKGTNGEKTSNKQARCEGKIKGNANSKIYHVPGGAFYKTDIKEIVWFCTENEAQKAGYRKSKR